MWPFDKTPTAKTQKQLLEIWERLDGMERRIKSVELEWELAYDKLHVMLGRVAKRAEKMHESAESEGRLHPEPEDAPETLLTPTWSKLTARQKQLQMQILQRRGNGGSLR